MVLNRKIRTCAQGQAANGAEGRLIPGKEKMKGGRPDQWIRLEALRDGCWHRLLQGPDSKGRNLECGELHGDDDDGSKVGPSACILQ